MDLGGAFGVPGRVLFNSTWLLAFPSGSSWVHAPFSPRIRRTTVAPSAGIQAENVHKVYDAIASHWNHTPGGPAPFLPPSLVVGDVVMNPLLLECCFFFLLGHLERP